MLSENNMKAVVPNTNNTVRASIERDIGKWYWLIEILLSSSTLIGIVNENATLNSTSWNTQNAHTTITTVINIQNKCIWFILCN